MSKNIDTLVSDIYGVFDKEVQVSPEVAQSFGDDLARIVVDRVGERKKQYLRLSNLGSRCRRQLWYRINCAELAEKLPGYTRIKFLIGDITEAVILFLARLAGHNVTNEQEEVSIDGIKGHIDGLIDDELVDVKSASPYSFEKFKAGLVPDNDAFGYISQIGTYAQAKGKSKGHFLAVDKVLGHLHLDSHDLPEKDYGNDIAEVREMLSKNQPPDRGFEDEKDGESGNRKLGVGCSYCEFKQSCWPGVRTIPYSGGPRYLTKVVREPQLRGKRK